jgi:hypothetical protein
MIPQFSGFGGFLFHSSLSSGLEGLCVLYYWNPPNPGSASTHFSLHVFLLVAARFDAIGNSEHNKAFVHMATLRIPFFASWMDSHGWIAILVFWEVCRAWLYIADAGLVIFGRWIGRDSISNLPCYGMVITLGF